MLPITVTIHKARNSEWGSHKTSWFAMFETRITLTLFITSKLISAHILHILCGFQQAIFPEHVARELEKKISKAHCKNMLELPFYLATYTSIFPD